MPLPVIIVDDELHGSESLSILLEEYCPDLCIKAIAANVADAVLLIRQHRPEIVFLDIEMPDGSGFEVIERTKDLAYHVVFTTAYEQYALKALKINALDYLLKPVSSEELMESVKKIARREAPLERHLEELLDKLVKPGRKDRISIPSQDGFVLVETDNIMRLEADSNYTHVFTADKKKLTISKTLKELETMLGSDLFFRIHSTHIVNLNMVEKYVKGDGGYVILNDGCTVPVSRAKKTTLLLKLNL